MEESRFVAAPGRIAVTALFSLLLTPREGLLATLYVKLVGAVALSGGVFWQTSLEHPYFDLVLAPPQWKSMPQMSGWGHVPRLRL